MRRATRSAWSHANSYMRPPQSRSVSTFVPTNTSRLDNTELSLKAKAMAKATNTTYVSPSDLKKGRFSQAVAEEPFHVVVDQADIRTKGGAVNTFIDVFGGAPSQAREMTLVSCHGGTPDHSGRSRATDLADHYQIPVTAPVGQAQGGGDEDSSFRLEVGRQESLNAPFQTFDTADSLITASPSENGRAIHTPTNPSHPLFNSMAPSKKRDSSSRGIIATMGNFVSDLFNR